jgi:putative N6-adenine-specific DNA methylase
MKENIQKAIAITNKGFEDITEEEIKEICGKSVKTMAKDSVVIFETTKQNILKVAYRTQTIRFVFLFIEKFEFSSIDDFNKKSKNINYSDFVSKEEKFAVKCYKNSDFDKNISSYEIEKEIADNIQFSVDLKNPDIIIGTFVTKSNCYIGIDICGFDMSRRYYKIFNSPKSIKGNLAFFLLKRANYSGKERLLDPMAGSGTIPIEAAHYSSKRSLNYYRKKDYKFLKMKIFEDVFLGSKLNFFKKEDALIKDAPSKEKIYAYDNQLSCVNSIKKNAKIAGVSKYVFQGRGEIDWIDTKFNEKSIDIIVTNPPAWSKFNEKKNTKLFEQLFSRAKPILKKSGKIVILTNTDTVCKIAKSEKFKLNERWEFKIGDSIKYIFSFSK